MRSVYAYCSSELLIPPICIAFKPACFIVFEPVGDMANSGIGRPAPALPEYMFGGMPIDKLLNFLGDSRMGPGDSDFIELFCWDPT